MKLNFISEINTYKSFGSLRITYLNYKYGLKNSIIEWAVSIINGIKTFSGEDSKVFLFGKILKNEIEEDFRFTYERLKKTVEDLLQVRI